MKADRALETTLGGVSLRVASSLELDRVLGEITRGLVSALDAALARVWLLPRRGGPAGRGADVLELAASAGLSERLDGTRSRVPVGSLKIGEIASTRTPVLTNDLLADPRFVDKAWIRDNALRSFAGYPLVFDGELLGVLAMFARRSLSEVELERLGAFAAQASVAIHHAGVFADVTDHSQRLEAENSYLKEELLEAGPAGIVGHSPALVRVLQALERVAPTMSTVLLRGETGTGKELFARALHEMSPRRARPLVKVNCAAITPTLIESELFGHEKGAFTGAVQRRLGRFELAHGGTIFLDEIGELPVEAQVKLLRVLQEHEVERVGGSGPIRVDVRVAAATNRDLEGLVREGRFRADLFYRLQVFPIVVPPLRERRDDIPLLVTSFVRALAKSHGGPGGRPAAVDPDAMAYLQAYDWPGNVRELHNVVERAVILARTSRIRIVDLPELSHAVDVDATSVPQSRPEPEAARVERVERVETERVETERTDAPLKERVDAYERALIAEALRAAGGNQSEAARRLRTSRATLQYKMKLHGL